MRPPSLSVWRLRCGLLRARCCGVQLHGVTPRPGHPRVAPVARDAGCRATSRTPARARRVGRAPHDVVCLAEDGTIATCFRTARTFAPSLMYRCRSCCSISCGRIESREDAASIGARSWPSVYALEPFSSLTPTAAGVEVAARIVGRSMRDELVSQDTASGRGLWPRCDPRDAHARCGARVFAIATVVCRKDSQRRLSHTQVMQRVQERSNARIDPRNASNVMAFITSQVGPRHRLVERWIDAPPAAVAQV